MLLLQRQGLDLSPRPTQPHVDHAANSPHPAVEDVAELGILDFRVAPVYFVTQL